MGPDDVMVELSEFRADAERYVGHVQNGATVVVQSNGVTVAHVVPPPAKRGRVPYGALADKIVLGTAFDYSSLATSG